MIDRRRLLLLDDAPAAPPPAARLRPVICPDTGRNITALILSLSAANGYAPRLLLALCIAEAGLREHAERWGADCDVSFGLVQQSVCYVSESIPGVTPPAGDRPSIREILLIRDWYWDAARALGDAAPRLRALLARAGGDELLALCYWNAPYADWAHPNPQHAANRENYRRALEAARAYEIIPTDIPDLPPIVDAVGTLPTYDGGIRYGTRPLAGIVGCTLHYTAGSPALTARDIAAYQTSQAAAGQTGAGQPFPGIAYTYFVEGDGRPLRCWPLQTRTWHSAAVVGGVSRNASHVGICYSGDRGPNAAQLRGLAACIVDVRRQLPPVTALEGHRDPNYPTLCPGPLWPGWRGELEALL